MNILLINGVSGSGKTTLSKALVERSADLKWIHPDGLMDTPGMTAEEILAGCLSRAERLLPGSSIVIDCQIRPSSIEGLLRSHPVQSCAMVLLVCPRTIREERLLDRGWPTQDFDQIDTWASILLEEARSAGSVIIDTSETTVDLMVGELDRRGIRYSGVASDDL